MSAAQPFIPGRPPSEPGLLARYLSLIHEGVVEQWLKERLPRGAWVLDPFGVLPRLATEIAQAGYRLLVVVSNPITRLLFELAAQPPSEVELQATLADLAVSLKGNERLESHIRSLYMSECARCGQPVEVQSFIWDRHALAPAMRIYHCPHCLDSGEKPTNQADVERARRFTKNSPHWLRALESVTPLNDPDRRFVAEALEMYLPRTVYALFTLLGKVETFPASRRRSLNYLFLSAFDQTNLLWHYPPVRLRPRQLTLPARFREYNVWMALEEAIEQCKAPPPLDPNRSIQVSFTKFPDLPPPEGGICLFSGRLKDLTQQWRAFQTPPPSFGAVVTALPRPNQAYWTLCALWSGWLWGHSAVAPFKSVLRRRRYDWHWHTAALRAAFHNLAQLIPPTTPCLGLMGEARAAFLSSVIIALDMAGMELTHLALRQETHQVQIVWQPRPQKPIASTPAPETRPDNLQRLALKAAQTYLWQRAEPVNYLQTHAAILFGLAQAQFWSQNPPRSAGEALAQTDEALQEVFSVRGGLLNYSGSRKTPESGVWWLREGDEHHWRQQMPVPLADRVEIEVVRFIQNHPGSTLHEADCHLCNQFPGLLTPDLTLIEACLKSYAEQIPPESDLWHLRPQEAAKQRRADLDAIQSLLASTGNRLGYTVRVESVPNLNRPYMLWLTSEGASKYAFYILASTTFGNVVFHPSAPRIERESEDWLPRNILVIPGSRVELAQFKLQRDPHLRSQIESDWRLVKFRHVRWLAERDSLNQGNFDQELDLDPLTSEEAQMPLL